MNTLTWMIYLADVADSLDDACGVGIAVVIAVIFCTALVRDSNGEEPRIPDGWLKKAGVAVSILGALAVVSPSKDTVYAMAASEVGEQVLKSPIVTKAAKSLEAWIDSKIPKDEPKK